MISVIINVSLAYLVWTVGTALLGPVFGAILCLVFCYIAFI